MRDAGGGCGGGGRRAVRALLRLSDRGAAPESRAPGCGWEEAVQGWGTADPLACFQLQKQIKKSKASETSNNCLLCLDMLQATDKCSGQEVKTTRNQSKSESKLSVEADTASEEISIYSSKSNCSTTYGSKTEIRNKKVHSFRTCQGEKKNLPIKEYCMWNLEDVKNPDAVKHKTIKPQALDVLDPNGCESLTSKSSQVLPPVKHATPKDTSDPSWKNKQAIILLNTLNGTSVEIASCSHDAKGTEQKGKKGADTMNDKMKEKGEIHEPSAFFSSHSEVSLLQEDPEQLSWDCALTSDRSIATIPNPIASKKNIHHACMQVPHTKGIQYTKHDIRGSLTYNARNRYAEVKEGNKSKMQAAPLLSGLLPSLKATHTARAELPPRLN
ncbi:uncharacterized protein C16orf46 homolog [Cygnus atratus]|uniref:uncharacterized protein C16orf46 homolog n=1 Tax=Cygnus atratus TaxID=8868 RepID=UPI0015D6208F|nr:uncharacterized protein C16orf46 homolog [Cygnus atratus]